MKRKNTKRLDAVSPELVARGIDAAGVIPAFENDRVGMDLAHRRMGRTPEDRLRWVIDFTKLNLDDLRPGERIALGYDLLALPAVGWQGERWVGPMLERDLRRLQREIAKGLSALLREPGIWYLPRPRRVALMRQQQTGRVRTVLFGKEHETIIAAAADLATQVSDRLRPCSDPECAAPLVVTHKRRTYCSTQCSQRVRDRRRKAKEAGEQAGARSK